MAGRYRQSERFGSFENRLRHRHRRHGARPRYKLILEGKGAPYLQLLTTITAKNGFDAVIKKTLGAKATLDGTVIEMDNL